MTEPAEPTEPSAGRAPQPEAPGEPAHDPEVLQLAGQVFDLARQGDTDRLAAYVDAGVPADLTNDRGDTLLMLAAYHGNAATVRALLERGAEADRTNDRGQTPLAGAVFKGARDVIAALVDAGADPAAGTPSAIDTARMFGKADLLALFGAG
jgi:ankyrin repeat protein